MGTVKKILLLTTGGTIAGNVASDKRAPEEAQTSRKAKDFSELIKPTKIFLNERWNLDINITPQEVCDVDSSDIVPVHWKALVDEVVEKYDDYDAFVITHGTNTLGYTCAAMSFAIANLNKPVVLTGSQVPAGHPGSDALLNLNNAIRVAAWPHEPTIKGVVAVFGSHVMTGTRVKKSTEFDYDAFQSFSTASIGRIGRIINIFPDNLKKHLSYLETNLYNRALSKSELIVENDFDLRIASLTEFPGMSPDWIVKLVDSCDIRGVVFRAFGAGDVSTHLRPALEYLKAQRIPIVVTTQAPNGNSNFQVNAPGQELKEGELAIPAYDMSIEAQTTKLAWLLAKKAKGRMEYSDIGREMVNDIRGEITVLKELRQ